MKKLILATIAFIMIFTFTAKAVTLLQVPEGGTGLGSVTAGSYMKGAGTGALVPRTVSEVKTDLSLNSVENTALSTWAGTGNITTLGTISTGVWNGTALTDAYVSNTLTCSEIICTDCINATEIEDIYLLNSGDTSTGTQTFNENIEMKDDKYLYFDTAKTASLRYSSAHGGGFVMKGAGVDEIYAEGQFGFYANTGADGSGNWDPYFDMLTTGIITLSNYTQGDAGSRYLRVHTTDGMRLKTAAATKEAIILADNIATSNKTFQFPNYSGTFITSGNLTDITTVGTIAAGTWNGTAITDAYVSNTLTVDGYMQDGDINTFTELQSWVSDETLLKAGTLTDTKYCIYDSASTDIICNSTPAGTGDLLADGTIPMTADFNLDGNNLDNGGVIFLKEQADADADIAGQGQIWVNTATPNELWFTDDAGTDVQLGIDTTYTAGRSLTLDGTTVNADAELYTDQTGTYIESPVVESLNDLFLGFMNNITITYVKCKTDTGTVSINLEDGSDNNILSAELVCDAGGQTSCASGCDVNTINASYDNITAKTEDIDYDASATASSPTKISLMIGYTIDD